MSSASPHDPARIRRTMLTAGFLVGALTFGSSLAGSLVNFLHGPLAVILAITGAVLAGSAAIVALLVSAPAAVASVVGAADLPAEMPTARSENSLHPVAALRSMRLPLAVALVASGPWFVYQRDAWQADEGFLTYGPQEDFGWVLMLVAGLLSVLIPLSCWIGGFNTIANASGLRRRGNGIDAVVSYTLAAGIGVWQWETVLPAWGIAAAGLVLLAATLFTSLVEDDLYRHGPGPVALAAFGAVTGAVAAYLTNPASPMLGLSAVLAAALVVVPAGVRGRWPTLPAGSVEVTALIGGVAISIATSALWLAAGAVVTVLALLYSWRYPQEKPIFISGFWFMRQGKVIAVISWALLLLGFWIGGSQWLVTYY
ncbi:hypothetical protein AB0A73_21645 [Glycomyces sp. NPDC047369]